MSASLVPVFQFSDEDLVASAKSALQATDASELVSIGGELERRGIFPLAWECLSHGARLRKPWSLPAWSGPENSAKTLLIRRRMRHLGAELRNARFINNALKNIDSVIVATEARLVPLLARSFPAATVVDIADAETYRGADCEASYEHLAVLFGRTDAEISQSFVPLSPPSAPAHREPNGIGIAWFSLNARKHLPQIEDWAEALLTTDCPIRSLQYDEQSAGFARLNELVQKRLLPSLPIDQMTDVDAFAGQVSSNRGVLTISNTTAHMAGALGIPCVVLLDDVQHLTWPSVGALTPFYPNTRLLRQNGRPWSQIVLEGLSLLQVLIDEQ